MRKQIKRLNIPAVLVHTVDNTKYEVKGIITSINESSNTCSMKFNGYPIQDGIPMDSIYLNEAFIDKVKDYSQKAWETIKRVIKKVKGFLLPLDSDGNVDFSCLNAPINMAIAEQRGMLSPAVKIYPSQGMIDAATNNGVRLSAGDIDEIETSDIKAIDTYWKRVMKRYVKDEDSTVSEAVKYVNENYYKTNKALKHINEAPTVKLGNLFKDQYGKEVNTKQLKALLTSNILKLILPQDDDEDSTAVIQSKEKPLLIWGAPGVGKTAIIKQAINTIRNEYGIDLALESLAMGQMNREDFVLPDTVNNIAGERGAIDVPKTWLPVYYPSPDPVKRKQQDEYYNSGLYKYTKASLETTDGQQITPHKYYGGIIFMDEFSRMGQSVGSIVMNLINDKVYQGMTLASRWGFVLAANRAIDMLEAETSSKMEAAQADRYISYMFVPTKGEWLEWARGMNNATGRLNVDEMICAFIEQAPDGVWYDSLDLGSRKLSNQQRKVIQGDDIEQLETIFDDIDPDNPTLGLDKVTWTPRDWDEKISGSIIKELKRIFSTPVMDKKTGRLRMQVSPLFNDIFVDGNISQMKLAEALDQLDDKTWNRWYNDYSYLDDGKMSRVDIFRAWITEHIEGAMGGEDNLPAKSWKDYNEWQQTFTSTVIKSIWETHEMPSAALRKSDDEYHTQLIAYRGDSAWKKNTLSATNVFQKILDNFPGGSAKFTKLVNETIENEYIEPGSLVLKDFWSDHSDAEINKIVSEMTEYFSIQLGGKKIYVLREPGPVNLSNQNDRFIVQCLATYTASPLPRMLANIILYAGKIKLQVGNAGIYPMVKNYIFNEMYNNYYSGKTPGYTAETQLQAYIGSASDMLKLPYPIFAEGGKKGVNIMAASIAGIAHIIASKLDNINLNAAIKDGNY